MDTRDGKLIPVRGRVPRVTDRPVCPAMWILRNFLLVRGEGIAHSGGVFPSHMKPRPTSLFAGIHLFLAVSLLPLSDLRAAEEREWMSRLGGTVVATLASLREDEVALLTPESKEIKVKLADLSLADRQYLVEFGGADASILTELDPGTPEKDLRLDSSKMIRRDQKLALGTDSLCEFEVLETPKFWIATAGDIRPQALAETAERMWHGMAFQHMNFRKDWGDRRLLIIAVENPEAWKALGKWTANEIGKRSPEAAERLRATWPETGSTQIHLPEEIAREHKLMPRAVVFNAKDATRFRRPMAPSQIHSLAGFLLSQQMGGVSSFGADGYYAILTGHSYHKEIQLAGKSETSQLSMVSDGADISRKSGFDDGRSWARTLRGLVRKGDVKPSLAETLGWNPEDLEPANLVTIYALNHYMQSDSKRLSAYSRMIRRIESSNQIPEPVEIARIFGHESVEKFDEDWTEFILMGDFR